MEWGPPHHPSFFAARALKDPGLAASPLRGCFPGGLDNPSRTTLPQPERSLHVTKHTLPTTSPRVPVPAWKTPRTPPRGTPHPHQPGHKLSSSKSEFGNKAAPQQAPVKPSEGVLAKARGGLNKGKVIAEAQHLQTRGLCSLSRPPPPTCSQPPSSN